MNYIYQQEKQLKTLRILQHYATHSADDSVNIFLLTDNWEASANPKPRPSFIIGTIIREDLIGLLGGWWVDGALGGSGVGQVICVAWQMRDLVHMYVGGDNAIYEI